MRPAGVPIGRALDVPAEIAYDDLREVVAAIDRVHGDGNLPRIPVRLVEGFPELGRFRFDPTTGEPISIVIRADQRFRRLTLLHEVGHYIDWYVLGGRTTFGSAFHPMMEVWLARVVSSRSYRQLDALAKRGKGVVSGARIAILSERERTAVRNALLPDECWARSYAQYVALRSAASHLAGSLTVLRTPNEGRVYYPLQWEDEDFRPIAMAIDELFDELGWRTW